MRMMKPWWLASALLLANVSAAQGPKALREEFRNPSLRYRMNVNRHSVPREERAQDSMIRWILDNGYRGMATNVNPDDYLRSDDELAVFNRFVHAAKKQGLDLWLYDERSYPSGMAHTYVLEGHPEWEAEGLLFRDTTVRGGTTLDLAALPDYFVEAAAKVLRKTRNVRFVMAGSGDMLKHIVRRVAKLGIADRFHFTGFLKGDEVQRMFALSDVYVMPSVSEPFGISPLEAMRSNVPVIISKQSGVAEVLDYAIKVDYWDVDALADAIYGLVEYPALAEMATEKGLGEVTNLKWENAAGEVANVYRSLL